MRGPLRILGGVLETNAYLIVSLIALGMGVAFVVADRRSPASRALAGSFVFIGLSIYLNVVLFARVPLATAWSGWLAVPEAIAIVCVLEWILRVRRTLPVAPGVDTRAGDYGLRLGQLSGLVYGAFSLLWPQLRLQAFIRAADHPELFLSADFWLFMAPIALAMFAGLAGILLLLNRRPDRAEAIRVVAMALATPLFVAGFVLPVQHAALSVALGEIVFLIGAVRYHVLQGQRGQFLSRFLSPEVARLVSERGLDLALRESSREITVVCSDLRGFTAYAAAHPSGQVLAVLREYYDAVGREAAAFGATIKDYAGDGVLMLVGAPLPVAYHAQRGIELAQRIRSAGAELCRRWSRPGTPLGIGVGVATGNVTVGVVGSASRLEYTAVGSAVNLAARLCEQAGDGEILIDACSAELSASTPLLARPPLQLKGFAAPVPHFAVPAAA